MAMDLFFYKETQTNARNLIPLSGFRNSTQYTNLMKVHLSIYNYNFSKTYCQCSAGDQTNSAVRSKLPYIVQVVVVVVVVGEGSTIKTGSRGNW